ncbi:MAG: Error-prone repair protein ImuA [Chitinophagaceae bacterium]
MVAAKENIIAQLQKDILPLQGFKSAANNTAVNVELGPIMEAFPNAVFPLGAVHEFVCTSAEDAAASGGFIAGILSALMQDGGACLWISSSRTIFPPALQTFGIEPDKIIFIDLQKEKEILWTMEEALKCDGLAAVVGEIQELSFMVSRRLQLAVEKSGVTGFILRRNPRHLNTTACVSRWKISSIPSLLADDMPGVGFPGWNIELLKIRNGKPGSWSMEWVEGKFRSIYSFASIVEERQKKTG